jgi:hypothetical protein
MPLVSLSPYKKAYSSEVISLSTLLGFVVLLTAILIPLFAAFATEDFWLRIKEYTEQPLVDYTEQYMVYISKFDKDKKLKSTTFRSSNTNLNDRFEIIIKDKEPINQYCHIEPSADPTTSSTDIDGDEIKDKINIKYIIDKGDIVNFDIKLLFFLKYGLTKKVRLIMTPIVYLDIPVLNVETGGKEITLSGNLELVQKSPIHSTTITSQMYYKKQPFGEKVPYFDLLYYYNEYKSYNYTVKYNYEKIESNIEDNKIIINMDMYIPKLQEVLYYQSVFEAIKYAWMQYFYIFLPIYFVLYILFKFIIQNNIFYSNVKSDL